MFYDLLIAEEHKVICISLIDPIESFITSLPSYQPFFSFIYKIITL